MGLGIFSIYFSLLFVLLGVIKQNSKIITYSLLLLLFLLFSYEHTEGDYAVYERLYYNVGHYNEATGYELLYELSCQFFNRLGLSFDQMRAIFSIAEISLLFFFAKKYTKNTAYIFALFLVFPATLYAELFRFLVGMTIIIWGVNYLLKDKTRNNIVKYFVCVLCASLFHSSCWMFLIYYLLLVQNRRRLLLVIFISILLGIALIQFNVFFVLFSFFAESERLIDKYGSNESHNLIGMLSEMFKIVLVVSMGVCAVGLKNLKRWRYGSSSLYKTGKSGTNLLLSRTLDLNLISILLFIPLYYSSLNDRLLQPIIFINYVALGCSLTHKSFFNRIYGVITCVVFLLIKLLINGEGSQMAFFSHFTEGYIIRMASELFGY